MRYFRRMKNENTHGGARANSGPKVLPEIGKSLPFGVSLYQHKRDTLVKHYGSLTQALNWAYDQITPVKCKKS